MKLPVFAVLFTCCVAAPALAADWTVLPAQSRLGFSGTQTGAPFQGMFQTWTARISYNPADPQAAQVKITVATASAKTGDTQRDEAMPEPDWFNAAAFPQAVFEATGFTRAGGDNFITTGTLTIRGVSQKLTLPFTLDITGKQAVAKGHVSLLRTAYGVGQGSWSTGYWVGLNVDIDFSLTATTP